jgi:hypothetical protein
MRATVLVLKLLLYGYLAYLLVFLSVLYHPEKPGFNPPFILFVLDTVNLFIHEAGHFFFGLFGRWIHMISGSLFQVLLPLALLVVTLRQRPAQAALPGFWVGESMVNVSVYIRDAPYRQLRLIARGLTHDWNWLLSDNLEAAEPLADIVFGIGILFCCASVVAGFWFAVRTFREARVSTDLP